MTKRILLFVATNIAIVVTISIVFSLLGIGGFISPEGQLLLMPLALFSLIWGMGAAFISLLISRWVAKRAYGVQLVDGRTGDPTLDWLHQTVAQQARAAGLPMPEVGIYDAEEVNAFATGPSKSRALVAVSTGLLRRVDREGVQGVLAHEVAHIKNGDMVTMTLIQGVVNAFVIFVSRIIGFAVRQAVDARIAYVVEFAVVIASQIALGILGSMVTAWFSRQREFRADAGGAELAGGRSMISALEQLKRNVERVDDTQPALASLKIAGRRGFLRFFSTHPDLDVRIAALRARYS